MACAAMGGGVAIVDWSGRESRSIDEIDEANKAEAEAGGVESESGGVWEPGSLSVAFRYEGHGSIAYGADWGWKRGGRPRTWWCRAASTTRGCTCGARGDDGEAFLMDANIFAPPCPRRDDWIDVR